VIGGNKYDSIRLVSIGFVVNDVYLFVFHG